MLAVISAVDSTQALVSLERDSRVEALCLVYVMIIIIIMLVYRSMFKSGYLNGAFSFIIFIYDFSSYYYLSILLKICSLVNTAETTRLLVEITPEVPRCAAI